MFKPYIQKTFGDKTAEMSRTDRHDSDVIFALIVFR